MFIDDIYINENQITKIDNIRSDKYNSIEEIYNKVVNNKSIFLEKIVI